jgi:hypothetical protein
MINSQTIGPYKIGYQFSYEPKKIIFGIPQESWTIFSGGLIS